MNALRSDDLIACFEDRNNRFRNSAGMEFGKADVNLLWTFLSFSEEDYGLGAFEISTEDLATYEFNSTYFACRK